MKPWIEPEPVFVPDEFAATVGGHPLIAETLIRRGKVDPECVLAFLEPDKYIPTPGDELPGIDMAVSRLAHALTRGERIGVWGDFDVDGQTATTVLVTALRELAADVIYHIPVRARESHGVHLPELKEMLSQSIGVLITCDTGIAAHESLSYAQARGVDVLLTDHHELPAQLPPAYSISNPRLLPEDHPLASLPGVGVAYKLVEALYEHYHRQEEAEKFLDLVALGIVADVASLTGDTRFLLQLGLEALRKTERTGLKAIYTAAELDPRWLSEEHIAFFIAPRLNAMGRLADANPVVELLSTQDEARAHILASQIESLNDQRKLLTTQVFQGALSQIKANPDLLNEAALVLSNPHWPAGIIGIVASRLVERFDKPAVLLACPQGETARGSARSVAGVHITQAFTAAEASEPGLISGFGGHAAAAGLSLDPERIPDFRRRLSRAITHLFPDRPTTALSIDGWMPFSNLSLELVADLERLSPFGAGNPALILAARGVRLVSSAPVGRSGEHVQLIVEDESGQQQRVLWWQGAVELQAEPLPSTPFDLAYTVRASSFRGQRQVQVEWVSYRVLQTDPLEPASHRSLVLHDHRQAAYPLAELQQLRTRADLLVWAEGEARLKLPGKNRLELDPHPTLVIWTIPPGRKEVEQALSAVSPSEVHLFAADPKLDQLEVFLARLAGLAKHSLAQPLEIFTLSGFAAAMAHRTGTIRSGLTWLKRKGFIDFTVDAGGLLLLTAGTNQPAPQHEIEASTAHLTSLLEETAAFRSFYRRAAADVLVSPEEKAKKQSKSQK